MELSMYGNSFLRIMLSEHIEVSPCISSYRLCMEEKVSHDQFH